MKRVSTPKSKSSRIGKIGYKYNGEEEEFVIDWEVRPGGLLVQKRGVSSTASGGGPMIKIKVSHNSRHHDISLPARSSFGDLKRFLANETGLQPKEQRLLFGGKEKDDEECLHMAGVNDMSKVVLLEDPASKERRLEEKNKGNIQAYEAVVNVRADVDKLSDKVASLETAVENGINVAEKEFAILTELLMVQLLKLDSIKADGEARVQRRIEVHRVQSFVDKLDNRKAIISNTSSRGKNAASVTTEWETFDSGIGSVNAPKTVQPAITKTIQPATKVTQDWEMFD